MSADWVEFDALVEPLVWGRSVYTVMRLEPSLEAAARAQRTRRVEGTVEDVVVNVGVNRADVIPDAFAYVGKGLQRRLGVAAGDVVRCRLRPADPDHVALPPDVRAALDDSARMQTFEARSAAERRRLLQPIEEAARPATRRRRIEALVRGLGS